MRILANQTGVIAPDSDNLKGKIEDGTTVIGEPVNGDIIETMQKMVSEAGITENDLPDNETNKHQMLDAMSFVMNRRKTASARHYLNISGGSVTLPSDNCLDEMFLINSGSGLLTINYPNIPTNNIVSIIILFPYTNTIGETGNINLGGIGTLNVNGNYVRFTLIAGIWYGELIQKADTLITKVIDIGDWDMNTNSVIYVTHGVNAKKIRSINVIIRNDSDDCYTPLSYSGVSVLNIAYSATKISLHRTYGGAFDTIDYSSTSYNRGWITIQYTL